MSELVYHGEKRKDWERRHSKDKDELRSSSANKQKGLHKKHDALDDEYIEELEAIFEEY